MGLKEIQAYIMVAILCAMLSREAMAQSSCTSTIVSLAPCLGYIQGSSSNPSSSCCSQLATVVKSQPRCLCSLINGGGSQFGITINQTLALALPGACNVQTPPISRCNGGNQASGPAAAPAAGSPIGSPDNSPADTLSPDGSAQPPTTEVPSATISKIVPSTNGSTSDANDVVRLSLYLTTFLLLISTIGATTTFSI